MYIPNQMKNQIAKVFYDKTIEVVANQTTTDAEGGIRYTGLQVISDFNGNVNFSNCKKIQEEYGLDYNIDISITTDYNLLNLNDLIKYQNIIYNVTDILKCDSHNLVVATKWHN